MKTHGKRFEKLKPLVTAGKKYSLDEAVTIIPKFTGTKFDQTVEIAVKLGIDVKKADQALRGSIALPRGIGQTRKVIVFAEGDDARAAEAAGADAVGSEDLVKKIQDGWTGFDVAIAHPTMMRYVGKLGKVLGPQGKMPSPKSGTVVENIGLAVKEFKAGKIEFRADAGGNIHAPVGKVSFAADALKENVTAFLDHIRSVRPPSAKGIYMQRVVLSATMSPGIPLEVS